METQEAINLLRSELAALRKDGHDHVTIAGLEKYLSGLAEDASVSADFRHHERQAQLAEYSAEVQSSLEMFSKRSITYTLTS